MIYLLDTMVMTELTRAPARRNRHVTAWLENVDDLDLATSALVVREMWDGLVALKRDHRKAGRVAEVERGLARVLDAFDTRIIAVDRQIATEWAQLLPGHSKRSMIVGIAATSRVRGLTLVTRNMKDFVGLGVPILDPFQSPVATHTP